MVSNGENQRKRIETFLLGKISKNVLMKSNITLSLWFEAWTIIQVLINYSF